MRLTNIEMEKISKAVLKQLKTAGIALTDGEKAVNLIIALINENIEAEKGLEEDALKLLKQHRKAIGPSLDDEKALRMIKQKLADERKFVL